MPSGTFWPVEQDDKAKEMWGLGYSASLIGAALGKTRNSVIGRLWRLGAPKREQSKLHYRQRRHTLKPYRGYSRPQKLTRLMFEDIPAPSSEHNVAFIDAKTNQCREIVGRGDDGLVMFCGAPSIGCSFCAYHYNINYRAPRSEPCEPKSTPSYGVGANVVVELGPTRNSKPLYSFGTAA
jgi:hypothetical protein